VVPLLALLPLLTASEMIIGREIGIALAESLFILLLIILGGRYFLQPILHRVALSGNREIFTASAVLIVLGTALLTERIGLSMAMGAFIAGLLISDSVYRHQVMAEIQPFRGLLLGLFFVSMGMSLNLELFIDRPLYWSAIVLLFMFTKLIILWPLAHVFGCKGNNSLGVALLLAQSGEFALVLFALAFKSSLIGSELFQQLLLIVLLSMLLTPLLAAMARRLSHDHVPTIEQTPDASMSSSAPIVLAGFGRVGHRIGDMLASAGQPFVALDSDPLLVHQERSRGHPVFFGDVRQPEVLNAAGASQAHMVIVTLNDPEASEQVVASLHRSHPQIQIIARGQKLEQCQKLRRLGARQAISENVEASIELTRIALTDTGLDTEQREKILSEFRHSYYRQIDDA
jgi:voltage-gated potassium channel Kch